MYYTLLYSKNDRDIQAAESNMAAGRHLESRVYSRHPERLPRFILKLRYPLTLSREKVSPRKIANGVLSQIPYFNDKHGSKYVIHSLVILYMILY